MKNIIFIIGIAILISVFSSGCNIVPKSVQYQKEEEKLIGSVDAINPRVEEIQVVLKGLGYETGNTDGRMGQETRDAIKEFQESIGIKSTGYIDELTLAQIDNTRRVEEGVSSGDIYKIKVRSAYSEKEISSATGFKPTTKEIQKALKYAGFDPGAIDGKMGPKTKQAIKEFQRLKGLKVDGLVGPKTWAELGKYLRAQP
jgi:peptidoglycan hydrolase-like protein with peptidoglycan-binding domain